MSENYPDNNPKTIYGVQKDPLHLVPPPAITAESYAFKQGAEKYGAYNWRGNSVAASVYYAAALRHIMAWWEGRDFDQDSGAHHLGHARACLGIVLDAQCHGRLIDDRPVATPPQEEF